MVSLVTRHANEASNSTVQYHAAHTKLIFELMSHWHDYKDDVPHMQEMNAAQSTLDKTQSLMHLDFLLNKT